MQASGLAFSSPTPLHDSKTVHPLTINTLPAAERSFSKPAAFAVTVDSIRHINCLQATGYLSVIAAGGVQPYTYDWSNGDTGPVTTNLMAGFYEVIVTDANGMMATVSATILEDSTLPIAVAGADFTAPCSNSILSLNGAGSSVGAGFQYLWTAAGGGVIQSGATTLIPVIKHTGNFTLKVTNTGNGCTSTASILVSATNEPPVVTATGGTFSCSQPLVTLNSTYPTPNTKFIWNGPNAYVSTLLHPQVGVVGTFVFKVTDTLTTCFNTANAIVIADTSKPIAVPVGGLINCSFPTLAITGTFGPAGITYSWIGPSGFTSALPNPIVSTAGLYRVTVTNPTNGCTATNTTTVTGNFTPPTATATVSGTLTCSTHFIQLTGGGTPAGMVSFNWAGPNGFASTLQSPVVSNPGIYTLTTKNPQNGCTAIAQVTVLLNNTPPGVTATGGLKTCNNPFVMLQASSSTQGVTYLWSGPSNYSSNEQNPTVIVSGVYTVITTSPANGCTSSTTVVVTQNTTPPALTTTTTTVSCYVPAPHIVASSTTPGATFSWDGPNGYSSTIPNPVVTAGGYYTVTATNPANGCTNAKTIFVEENLGTANVYAGEDRSLNCNFTTILANPIGTSVGTNFTYLWTTFDGHIFSGETTLYARFDLIGFYTLSVKNLQSGCIVKDSMEVTQSTLVELNTVELAPISCNGGNNGSIKAVPDGGSSPYVYMWSNGSQTATVNNLSAGTYTVTVSDSQGCSQTSSITILQPNPLLATVSATAQTQVGVNNGTATVLPTGGSPGYTVKWSNGSIMLSITNLAPGAYTVTVTDNKGCTKSNTANVNATTCSVSGEISATNLNCAGVASGTATVNVTGAPMPIVYNWSNGAQTKTVSNLAAGNYSVTVTGSNGCSTVLSTQITGPQLLVLSVVGHTDVLCTSSQNGTATVSAAGGTAPYTFVWSNGSTGASVTGLGAATYSCTTTDSHGCTATQNVLISSPPAVVLSVLTKTDVACNNEQTGSITMTATGGTSPFSYVWSNTATGPTLNNLGVGNYLCTVTDANGCSKNTSAQIVATDNVAPQLILKTASVTLNANGAATVTPGLFDNGSTDQCGIANWTVSPTSFTCSQLGSNTVTLTATDNNGNTATGTAIATIVDNTAPVLTCPTNQVASACASTVIFNAPQIQDNCTASGAATLISGLPSGTSFPSGVTQQQYSYTDAGGNTATCQFTVTVSGSSDVQTSVQPSSCSGMCDGIATLTAAGGGAPAGSVLWSNGQTSLTITDLCPGSYFATLTDAVGCSQTFVANVPVQDNQAPVVTCPNNIVAGFCNTAVTYAPPQVTDNCSVNLQQLQLLAGLPSGTTFPIGQTTQLYRYTDGGGNVAECSFSVTIHLAASVNSSATNATCPGECNGTVTITISGGQGPFGILWSNGAVGPVIANLCAGAYMATVTDADGCPQVQAIQVSQPAPISIGSSNISHDIMHTGVGNITISMTGGTMPYTYSWTLDGQFFSNSQNLFGLFMGEYVLVVTDSRGCTFTSAAFIVSSSVATTAPGDKIEWLLYPNPAQAEVFLKMETLEGLDTQLSIFDASGRLLLDQAISAGNDSAVRIDLSDFPDGMLLVRLTNELGSFSKMLLKSDQ
jgi:hypothetical protein